METVQLDYHSEEDRALGLLFTPEFLNKILFGQKGGASPSYESYGLIDQFFLKREIAGRITSVIVDHGWRGYHETFDYYILENEPGVASESFSQSLTHDLNIIENPEIITEIIYMLKTVVISKGISDKPVISGEWGFVEFSPEGNLRIKINLDYKVKKLFDF